MKKINNKLLMSIIQIIGTYAFRPVSDKLLVDLLLGTDFAYTGDD